MIRRNPFPSTRRLMSTSKTVLLTPTERSQILPGLSQWTPNAEQTTLSRAIKFNSFNEAWGFMSRVALRAVRLRLSARQPGLRRQRDGPARPLTSRSSTRSDSILIDEARTPLIISGPTEDRSDFYRTIDLLVKELIKDPATFEHDEKQKQALLTETGSEKIEEMLERAGHLADGSAGLYDPANISVVHHVNQALRANVLYQQDRDYIVRDGEMMLIDEFTGRMMHGRRLSEGLHQAIEAKEGVDIQPENQTLASVTIQNYFRLYDKLSGMTGTAATEAQEFFDIYKMDVSEIPTNRPVMRKRRGRRGLSDRGRKEQGDHRADRGLP